MGEFEGCYRVLIYREEERKRRIGQNLSWGPNSFWQHLNHAIPRLKLIIYRKTFKLPILTFLVICDLPLAPHSISPHAILCLSHTGHPRTSNTVLTRESWPWLLSLPRMHIPPELHKADSLALGHSLNAICLWPTMEWSPSFFSLYQPNVFYPSTHYTW